MILYVADTLRADALGCYGNEAGPSPELDALAAEGLLFENAFAPSSWTRASMASLLTGTHPRVHGAEDRDQALGDEARLLSEVLRDEGYATCLVTTNPNIGRFFRFDQAFDTFVELYDRREAGKVRTRELVTTADVVTDRALEWIADAPRPFLLVLLAIDPHSPYEPPPAFDRFGDPAASEVDGRPPAINRNDLSAADRERIRSLYHGEVAFNDAEVGRLVRALREDGTLDRSVFLFTSDHGEEFWERGDRGHGKTLHDEVLRVPLLLRYPPRVVPGRRGDLVGTVDVAPTLLELAGARGRLAGDGRSLLGDARRDVVFASLNLDGCHLLSARTPEWRLIVDVETGERRLERPGDAKGADHAAEEAEAVARLDGTLREHLLAVGRLRQELHGAGAAPTVDEGELPEEVRRELKALGYLGEE